ncbi:patatin-like phospholipase [Mucilaginibacter gracilis]|uniref:Patatin-like phospholipase n=1 Tax=Mucilaginibacter gracilis TaxID=423350 RepID=A0A495J6J9_9SPHI|nr:patatin-like phospholipase family protein [Mucilaginibacter gracilis]RKR84048.1 patatin-like phospholipase [Mucilaginibacter gracilis]
MKKTLKLGFAMGGGVSLGTFSGAALSEAIKQAVLQGGYVDEQNNFQLYERVIVDVFAGASAGSMSLAIMLRGLAYQTPAEIARATTTLENDPAMRFATLTADQQADLIAAQVVQDLQADIWINDINIDVLLGTTPEQQADLTYEAGLLRRGALEDLARKYFPMDQIANGFPNKRILADEVIFGSSLANLTGVRFDSRKGNPLNNPNYAASGDAFTSFCHQEFRVFHLFFNEQSSGNVTPENFPPQWMRYHKGPAQPGYFGDLTKSTAWSRIVATSIACGAFPFAFEPVVLERFKFEFEQWPEKIDQEVSRLATGRTDQISYPFTYMDGGTFNNEPVREAFRMAAFLDSECDPESFDRVIVFVDPSLDNDEMNYRVPIHQRYTVQKPRAFLGGLDGYDLVRKATLDRIIPHLSTLVSMLIDEGKVNENDKIGYIMDLFDKKPQYDALLATLINSAAVTAPLVEAVKVSVKDLIETTKINTLIPQGAITLRGELMRVCYENKAAFSGLKPAIDTFIADAAAVDTTLLKPFLEALYTIFIDLLLNLTGKSKESKIIAVAPVVIKADGTRDTVTLPGGYLSGFAGFMSRTPNYFEADLAKYCAQLLMRDLGMLKANHVLPPYQPWSDAQQKTFSDEYGAKLINLNARIDNLFANAKFIDIFPGIDQVALNTFSKIVKNAVDAIQLYDDPYYSFVFMVPVTEKSFEIDGSGNFSDSGAIKIDGSLFLVTELYYHYRADKMYWAGVHAQDGQIVIERNGFAFLPDRKFCRIDLPAFEMLQKANLMPSPVFTYRQLIDADAGTVLPAKGWTIRPGVRRMDETLL